MLPQKENWEPPPSVQDTVNPVNPHTHPYPFFSSHLLSVPYFCSSLPFVCEINHWVPQRLVLPPAHCGACLHFYREKGLTLFCPRRLASLPLTPSGLPGGHGRYLCFPPSPHRRCRTWPNGLWRTACPLRLARTLGCWRYHTCACSSTWLLSWGTLATP